MLQMQLEGCRTSFIVRDIFKKYVTDESLKIKKKIEESSKDEGMWNIYFLLLGLRIHQGVH